MRKNGFVITRAVKVVCVFTLAALAYIFSPETMGEAARRVLFVFVVAALFWAFEIIPLYATSLGVVLGLTFLLCRPGGVLGLDEGGYQMFMMPFGSSVIMLFLGGLLLAVAFQKFHVDELIARAILKTFGSSPYGILFGFMATTAGLSMWMSNTATTAMMVAMALPLLKQMDARDPFRAGLALSIPFAANLGGIGTPIGTPPNAIALGILAEQGVRLHFLSWMAMAVPLVVALLLFAGGLLCVLFPSRQTSVNFEIPRASEVDARAKGVLAIAGLTILLWLSSAWHGIPSALIALLSAGALMGTGLLNHDDLKKVEWDVLVLMWGGLALGKGLEVSGLAQWAVGQPFINEAGALLVVVLCCVGAALSTFMSNTAAANLLIPVAVAIPGESKVLLAVTVALSCSLAMALPVSTPPNAIAFATRMINSRDMLKAGLIISVVSVAVVVLGFKFFILPVLGLS